MVGTPGEEPCCHVSVFDVVPRLHLPGGLANLDHQSFLFRSASCGRHKYILAHRERRTEKVGEIPPCATRRRKDVRKKKPGRPAQNDVGAGVTARLKPCPDEKQELPHRSETPTSLLI
jgi:hypothetical protein